MNRITIVLFVSMFLFGCATDNGIKSVSASRVLTIAQVNNSDDLIDSLDSSLGWGNYGDKGAKITLSSVDGKYGQCMKVSYDMMDGTWIAITKNISRDLSQAKSIRFWIRGEGSANSIEIKLEDYNNTNFGYVIKFKSNIGAWMVVDIPIAKFDYWWGSKNTLNVKRIKNIHFAISKKDGDQGGAGKVYLDQLEMPR